MSFRSRRTRGYALIECLVLITTIGLMLSLCAGLIHMLLRLDQSGRDASDQAADLARLARDFRSDAHAANGEGPTSLETVEKLAWRLAGDRKVEYSVGPEAIFRTELDGEKSVRRETYRRPARASVRFERSTEESRPIVGLIIDRVPGENDLTTYRGYRIEAELGRHRRMTGRSQ